MVSNSYQLIPPSSVLQHWSCMYYYHMYITRAYCSNLGTTMTLYPISAKESILQIIIYPMIHDADPTPNECETGAHNCHANAECTDTAVGFNCTCRGGFTGNGRDCSGIIACAYTEYCSCDAVITVNCIILQHTRSCNIRIYIME